MLGAQYKTPTTASEVFTEWAYDLQQADNRTGMDTSERQELLHAMSMAARMKSGKLCFDEEAWKIITAHVRSNFHAPVGAALRREAELAQAWLNSLDLKS